MCLIIDNSVRDIVFGDAASLSGIQLRNRIDNGRRQLVVGGKLLAELTVAEAFRTWFVQARLSQLVREFKDSDVKSRTDWVERNLDLKSDDSHVVALALLSGCRVLCTADRELVQDFTDPNIVANPRGKVYAIDNLSNDRQRDQDLLRWTRTCRACRN